MRKAVWVGACLVALGLAAEDASAEVITIAVTGHITNINDTSLGVTVGQAVTGTYSYDTATPVSGPAPVGGTGDAYTLAAPPANIGVSVVGGSTYQATSTWSQQILVTGTGGNDFAYMAFNPASSGPPEILLSYNDHTNQWLSPPALPTTLPTLSSQLSGSISIYPPGSSGFSANIDTVTQVPSITVSPANGEFIAQQNFDAVLLLSAQLSVASMQASVNGTAIGLSYPGTCQLAAANNAQRAAVICPNASAVLAGLGGNPVTVNWLITLADGSTLTQAVVWNLVL